VEEANELLTSMQTEPTVAIWVALLSGYLNNKKLELGESIAENILELQPHDVGVLALVSNLYAAAKKWDDRVMEVRKIMKDSGSKKVLFSRTCLSTCFIKGKIVYVQRRAPAKERLSTMQ
jgi:dTDP-4-dehydrorhamnose 3,5-epimerase-like enzyme